VRAEIPYRTVEPLQRDLAPLRRAPARCRAPRSPPHRLWALTFTSGAWSSYATLPLTNALPAGNIYPSSHLAKSLPTSCSAATPLPCDTPVSPRVSLKMPNQEPLFHVNQSKHEHQINLSKKESTKYTLKSIMIKTIESFKKDKNVQP
jgi:hypothetical protein